MKLPHLIDAVGRTEESIADARQAVEESLREDEVSTDGPLGIVLHGSYARKEVTTASDFDYLIISYELMSEARLILSYRQAAAKARQAVAASDVGSTGLFGEMLGASDLVDRIGLEQDSNANTTRRVLFLEESVPLTGEDNYDKLMNAIVGRYIHDFTDRTDEPRVPRFLLNDIVRYWRTITVDFQAKLWRDMLSSGGVRHVKLRSTRKIVFFSTIVSVFLSSLTNQPCTRDLLVGQFRMSPQERILQLLAYVEECPELSDPLARLFKNYDGVTEVLGDPICRDELQESSHHRHPEASQLMKDTHAKTQEIHDAIMTILWMKTPLVEGQPSFAALSDKYLVL